MSKLMLYISLAFSKVTPLVIIVMQHLRVEEGWNLHLVAIFILIVIVHFSILKPIGEKVKVWDIQNTNTFFVFNFRLFRTIIIIGFMWWIWVVIHADYQNIYNTFMYVFASLVLGIVFRNISYVLEE